MDEFKAIEPEVFEITETHSSAEPMRKPKYNCDLDRNAYREFYENMTTRQLAIASLIYMVLSLALTAVMIIFSDYKEQFYFVPQFIFFAIIAVSFFMNKSSIKRTLDRAEYANNGKFPQVSEYFFDDEIVAVYEDPDKTSSFKYEDIKSVKETDNLYLIQVNLKMYILAAKNMTSSTGFPFEKFILDAASGMKKKKISKMKK
ncbi:MAG: YcxB family protein, partial [Clostridia bacterium]|nr:YcxB family protein [Clostridia bacterium]